MTNMNTLNDLIIEAQKTVGVEFPLTINQDFNTGKVTSVEYEKEWKTGGTEAVDTGEVDESGTTIFDYEEDYTEHKLTAEQVKKVEAWIKTVTAK